ncbi:MAG: hypothetical protein DWQ04_06865 [Chloroflexi bacterium]|nr:MAG: hypothetical protein DWQ04_06865 [Chloroflexota bacterium]
MPSLKHRTTKSSIYSLFAKGFQTIINLVRTIVLARIISIDDFGVYAFLLSIVTITIALPNSVLSGSFLHRAPESSGEVGINTHFTLNLILTTIWAISLSGLTFLFSERVNSPYYLVLIWSIFFQELANTHKLLLTKHVLFKRIALIQIITALATTSIAIFLAYQDFGIWSLISINIVSAFLALLFYTAIWPLTRVKISWHLTSIKYYFNFGSRTFVAGTLGVVLDRVDDLWTGYVLGSTPLGLYSKAYELATYPRKLMAVPLNSVAAATYAELKGQRTELTQAFVGFNTILIRMGFVSSGLLMILAPEFITLLLGEQWLPMLTTFRLMLIFMMLDPIKITIASVLVASGKPEQVGYARAIQLIVLIGGLIILGPRWGIVGVALTVDIMLFIGITLLLFYAFQHVDFSLKQLFLVPLLGMFLGFFFSVSFSLLTMSNQILFAIGKGSAFLLGYIVITLGLEKKLVIEFFKYIQAQLKNKN